jgi:hypothetical protein
VSCDQDDARFEIGLRHVQDDSGSEAPSRALNGFGDVYFDYDLV